MSRWVKSYNPDGTCTYFRSIEECCKVFGIKYHESLVRIIEKGGLADDGRTFFDYPTDYEVKMLERKAGATRNHDQGNTDDNNQEKEKAGDRLQQAGQ